MEKYIERLSRKAVLTGLLLRDSEEETVFLTIYPVCEAQQGKYKNNLAPVLYYEFQFVKYLSRFNSADWGYDYDIVADHECTRVRFVEIASEPGEAALRAYLNKLPLTDGLSSTPNVPSPFYGLGREYFHMEAFPESLFELDWEL